MLRRYVSFLLLPLAMLVLVTGCIREDFDDCDNVTIYFQYLADGDRDVLSQYMSKVDLYVFDESGRILGSGSYNQDELTHFAAVPSFRLAYGKRYKVVAVGNPYEHTEVVGVQSSTDFDDIFIQEPGWGDGQTVTTHDHNYLGQLEFVMPEQEGLIHRDTVTLQSSHINLRVEIHGLPAPADTRQEGESNMPYRLSIENSNAQTSFNNEVNADPEQKGTIHPPLYYDAETGNYYTTAYDEEGLPLFRMDHEGELDADRCEHVLVLTEAATGRELVRGSIYNYLQANEEAIDITAQEAELPISIEFDNGGQVSIKVPDWVIVDGKPEWQ